MFGPAERGNLHGNLADSIKVIIDSHRVLPVRAPLLTPFLSNGVEGSVLMSFFGVDLVGRVSDGLPIVLIGIDDGVEGRMAVGHCHKGCDHPINYLLSLMDLILKLGEDIGMLHG